MSMSWWKPHELGKIHLPDTGSYLSSYCLKEISVGKRKTWDFPYGEQLLKVVRNSREDYKRRLRQAELSHKLINMGHILRPCLLLFLVCHCNAYCWILPVGCCFGILTALHIYHCTTQPLSSIKVDWFLSSLPPFCKVLLFTCEESLVLVPSEYSLSQIHTGDCQHCLADPRMIQVSCQCRRKNSCLWKGFCINFVL